MTLVISFIIHNQHINSIHLLRQASAFVQHHTIATSFSGLGTPEIAGEMIANAAFATGIAFGARFTHSMDIDPHARHELMQRGSGCVFGDILERLVLDSLGLYATLEQKWNQLLATPVSGRMYCYRCQGDRLPSKTAASRKQIEQKTRPNKTHDQTRTRPSKQRDHKTQRLTHNNKTQTGNHIFTTKEAHDQKRTLPNKHTTHKRP